VVGLDPAKRNLIVVVVNTGEDSGSGATLPQLADYLTHLGVTNALTLDGSGSAQLFYRDGQVVTLPSDARPNQSTKFYRPVPVFLGFY
jgi:exopolysaccharide biosynthesis protein